MQKKNDALGKGIRSLLQNIDADLKSTYRKNNRHFFSTVRKDIGKPKSAP